MYILNSIIEIVNSSFAVHLWFSIFISEVVREEPIKIVLENIQWRAIKKKKESPRYHLGEKRLEFKLYVPTVWPWVQYQPKNEKIQRWIRGWWKFVVVKIKKETLLLRKNGKYETTKFHGEILGNIEILF